MEGRFIGIATFGNFGPERLMGIFTVNFADGLMDGMDNRYTDGCMGFQVESHFG